MVILFFDSYVYSSAWYGGLVLKNGVKIFASSGAKLIFNYTGTNSDVLTYYSPLNAGTGGFELCNVTIEASNCRYALHDEKMDYTDVYRNIYDHCNFKLDNSNNSVWHARNCIGGGLGKSGEIVIDGCYFESDIDPNYYDIVSYHNSSNTNAKSNIVIKNSYIKSGRFKFGYHGTSTNMTKVLIAGCKATREPLLWQEQPTDSTVNMEITQWNNIWS